MNNDLPPTFAAEPLRKSVRKSGRANESKEEREARLKQLRHQYENGTYEVDALTLSATIVDKHLSDSE